MPEFGFVIALVVVVTVITGEQGTACSGDSGFETVGLSDDEVGGDAAIRPAANGELRRVGDALLDGVIDHGYIVLKILVAPIRPDGLGVFLAVARRAARVRKQDNVA